MNILFADPLYLQMTWVTLNCKSRFTNSRPCLKQQLDRRGNIHPLLGFPYNPPSISRFNADEFLAVEDLPPPKKAAPKAEPEPARPKPAVMRQVGIADQIAIRSYVLGKGAKSSKFGVNIKTWIQVMTIVLRQWSFMNQIICRAELFKEIHLKDWLVHFRDLKLSSCFSGE